MFTANTARVIGRSVPVMEGAELDGARPDSDAAPDVTALIPMVRRIIYSRVANRTVADDLVQETLVKVLGAAHRVEPGMLEPYAIVTARNVVASMWKDQDRHRRNVHRVVDLVPAPAPDEELLEAGGDGCRLDGAEPPVGTGARDPAGPRGVGTGHPVARGSTSV